MSCNSCSDYLHPGSEFVANLILHVDHNKPLNTLPNPSPGAMPHPYQTAGGYTLKTPLFIRPIPIDALECIYTR